MGKSALSDGCSVSAFVHGNMDVDESRELAASLERLRRSCKTLSRHQKQRRQLSASALTTLNLPEPNKQNPNSASLFSCQLGFEHAWGDLTQAVQIKLIAEMTDDEAFDTLRTKENLGYIVFTFPERSHGVLSFSIMVESNKHTADYLTQRIEAFIQSHGTWFDAVTAEQYEDYKQASISKLRAPYTTMTEESAAYWDEIETQAYIFDRSFREIDVLSSTTIQEVVLMWQDKILDQKQRACLAVEVQSQNRGHRATNSESDIQKLRNSLSQFPRPALPPPQESTKLGISVADPGTGTVPGKDRGQTKNSTQPNQSVQQLDSEIFGPDSVTSPAASVLRGSSNRNSTDDGHISASVTATTRSAGGAGRHQ